ncbi:N-acetyltransferase [Clostridium sp.]|uniref:GNAT family N-acetyltransferase n=1 Tax=Clostridium sp. TaxID=1506 RepID=UPI001DF1A311|nr:GNAT family N-acetyltransferase [Clostridium sp.]MBS5938116.1 GNAT family N-acetyltransferase [Clostridium sp.]
MDNLEFVTGTKELIDLVKPLWEKLNKHHEVNSIYFSDKYKNNTFEKRKVKFLSDKTSKVKVDLIRDIEKDIYVGYCVSTVDLDLVGEIDSLFIEKEYRKYGLGDKLMQRAIEWLDDNKVKSKILGVVEGNENVLEFYKRHGFYKRTIVLERI